MLEVFVSRPNWVAPEFALGLDAFYKYLKVLGVNPRTLGVSDYPSSSPLDEVISLVGECAGAIILGYPQLVVHTGAFKGEPIAAQLTLGTEWNHMEAALVHAQKKPLLVVHHTGVSRGIFDRGTFSAFVHEYDLTNPQWVLTEALMGAMNTWKKKCI